MAAEAIGLAFGATSLTSLFQTCVEFYEYIDRGRTYSKDLAQLMTKLEIERIRLALWGEAVDICGENDQRHGVFERPQVRLTIHNLLNCIYMVFTSVQELSTCYGLDPITQAHDEHPEVGRIDMIRPVRFAAVHSIFRRSLTKPFEGLGMLNRMRWAVRDWKKFSAMIDDLKSFNDGLEVITKSIEAQERRPKLMQAALRTLLPDISSLLLVQEASTGSNNDWAEAACSIAEQSEVSTTAGRVLDWRRDIDRELSFGDIDHITLSTEGHPIDGDKDIHTLKGTLTKAFVVTTEICPSSTQPTCCLTSESAPRWLKIDKRDEIASLDENNHEFLFNDDAEVGSRKLVYFYIYCAPCWISVWTAMRICRATLWDDRSLFQRWRIRVDESLDTNLDSARLKLQMFLERVQDVRQRLALPAYIDVNHIRRRLRALNHANHVNTTTGLEATDAARRTVGDILKEHSSHSYAGNCAALVFITTPEVSESFNALRYYKPFEETPLENEIYHFIWDQGLHTMRKPVYLGAYENELG